MSIKDEFSNFINAGQEGSDAVIKDIPEAGDQGQRLVQTEVL